MDFRHEWKHRIEYPELLALRSRLTAVMRSDVHAAAGRYELRSMYFDSTDDKALREKLDGVNRREKFRLRYYNGDTSFILLEKKSKINGLCNKQQTEISLVEAEALAEGESKVPNSSGKPLLRELAYKMDTQGLRMRTIVDYTREPYVYEPGNVRVTLDYNIRTGLSCKDFLNPNCITIPAAGSPIILEVKWDEFLPAVIRDIVQTSWYAYLGIFKICCLPCIRLSGLNQYFSINGGTG